GADLLLVAIDAAHLGDDLALLEDVVEPRAIEYAEPAAFASILERLDEHGSSTLRHGARQRMDVVPLLVLAGHIGEIVYGDRDTLGRSRQRTQAVALFGDRGDNRRHDAFNGNCLASRQQRRESHCRCGCAQLSGTGYFMHLEVPTPN